MTGLAADRSLVWSLALSAPGAWASPGASEGGPWHPAPVPGTAAAALERLGLWDRRRPTPLHGHDIWYRTTIEGHETTTLICEGLATLAEIWLDGAMIARSDTMFAPLEVPLMLNGTHRLAIAFRSLAAHLATRTGPRARWRTRMVEEPRLRFVRTTMLGHAPGWCPPVHAVGPWRPIRLVGATAPRVQALRSAVAGTEGVVSVSVALPWLGPGARPRLGAGPTEASLTLASDGLWHGTLRVPDAVPWWPNTHGAPHLYDIELRTEAGSMRLARTGFRTLSVERGPEGRDFHLRVNGVRVFCRGLCWTPDPVTLDGAREHLEPTLRAFAAAHVNMLRVGGTMVYESAAFHALCDELGILVWQDCMLANFDYPRDEGFATAVLDEVRALLRRTAGSPSLAILCGGSEILQQAAMMGLAPAGAAHPLFQTGIPALLDAERPDVVFVEGSPSGGPLPFVADHGPSHYYGVGAYCRPIEDARRAAVRFASECLAFSNVPEDATLAGFGLDPVGDPEGWAAGVPRDNGADWSFEDTRHHYMALLEGVDAVALRSADTGRYLDVSRGTVAGVSERTFDEWRRPGSPCGGGLVWFARDLAAGAGWGVIDATGRPKSTFHALRRAFAPLRLFITDEGVNGLVIHCINDGALPIGGDLTVECLRDGALRVAKGSQAVAVPARGGVSVPLFAVFGGFFDAGHAYRFGAAPHDTVLARLVIGDATPLRAFWHLDHARGVRHAVAPAVTVTSTDTGWRMTLTCARALRGVVVSDRTLVPDDNWFDLAPNDPKVVTLTPLPGRTAEPPVGTLRALNLERPMSYG